MTNKVLVKNEGPYDINVFPVDYETDENDVYREHYLPPTKLKVGEEFYFYIWKGHSIDIIEISEK